MSAAGQPNTGSSAASNPSGEAGPLVFLGQADIAELLDVPVNTIKSCRQRGTFPLPDVRIGRVMGWLPQTVLNWAEHYKPARRHRGE